MGIKLKGWNKDGTAQCFTITHQVNYKSATAHHYTKLGLYQIGNARMGAAYMSYTGHWYGFDLRTGEQVATFTHEYFELAFAPLKICDLLPSKDCEEVESGA